MVLDKRSPWATAFDFQAMASVLCFGIFICSCDKRDDQVLYRCKKLVVTSVEIIDMPVVEIDSLHPSFGVYSVLQKYSVVTSSGGTCNRNDRNSCGKVYTYVFDFVSTIEGQLCPGSAGPICCRHNGAQSSVMCLDIRWGR